MFSHLSTSRHVTDTSRTPKTAISLLSRLVKSRTKNCVIGQI